MNEDRKEIKDTLYRIVASTMQDALIRANASFGLSTEPADQETLKQIHKAAGELGDALNAVESSKFPLVSALRNLATRSVELRHIARDLAATGDQGIANRLCDCATRLKEAAATQRTAVLAAEGPAR